MTAAPPPRAGWVPVALIALTALLWHTDAAGARINVSIEGVSGELESNVRAYLSIVRFQQVADLSPSNIRSMHARAKREIRQALKPFGYYAPEISASMELSADQWQARYTIAPGEPVRFASIDLELTGPGGDNPVFRAIVDSPGLASGDIARHSAYEALKRRLRQAAYENGFRDAELAKNRLLIDPDKGTADVSLLMTTGPQYQFGAVTYEQDILDEALVRRYPRFDTGEPFNARTLLDLEYALTDSEYFSVVEVTTGEASDLKVPIHVTATPRKRHKYGVGLGFGTDTGPRISLGWKNRRINRAGHRLALTTKLSAPEQEISGRYIIPLEDPVSERLTVSAAGTLEELGDTDSRKFELGVAQIRQLGSWQRDTYLRLLKETTTVENVDTDSTLLIPGVAYRRVRKDNPISPRDGSLIEGDIHGTHEALGSDTSFVQLRIETRLIRPVGERHRLILRATVGVSALSEFAELPASERFFAGGDQSVRGFGLNELGPTDDDDQVIGGKHLLTASAEYEWQLNPKWALAVFADGGNAIDSFSDSLEAAVGIGIRRRTQVGQIRLDLAQAITQSGESPRIHFSFGPEL